ncbi:MAG TPA: DUF1674 domain-containing protein [Xanthobacteraceae bacterium]|nr:DUF1674 domain-containing protein [Xanthobacteraceae bacterium]
MRFTRTRPDKEAPESAPVAARSPAAERALAEAAERRARAAKEAVSAPKEVSGREGPDPVRYGDWENRGIASDF